MVFRQKLICSSARHDQHGAFEVLEDSLNAVAGYLDDAIF